MFDINKVVAKTVADPEKTLDAVPDASLLENATFCRPIRISNPILYRVFKRLVW